MLPPGLLMQLKVPATLNARLRVSNRDVPAGVARMIFA